MARRGRDVTEGLEKEKGLEIEEGEEKGRRGRQARDFVGLHTYVRAHEQGEDGEGACPVSGSLISCKVG